MAWYSLYKWFISFRKLPYVNIINWYRRFLYEEWFNSLTEEEQEKEKARIKGLKEKEMAGLQRTCLTLGMLVGLYSNRIYQSVQHLLERKAMVKYTDQDLLVFIPGDNNGL